MFPDVPQGCVAKILFPRVIMMSLACARLHAKYQRNEKVDQREVHLEFFALLLLCFLSVENHVEETN